MEMVPPPIPDSTREQRIGYVRESWKCMHNCEVCGKCHLLRGESPETLYADYIEGLRSYREVTLSIRERNNLHGGGSK